MSCILYKLVDDKPVKESVKAIDVAHLLENGYSSTPEQLIKRKEVDTNNSGKLSDAEIKAAAAEAGIKVGKKSIKTLKKELGL
ncbi:MAG TPA: hypothetical protein EYN54_04780 [Methylococcaceae bacterium]|nr:hypothetical protein [Methylococcaceae bacterium]